MFIQVPLHQLCSCVRPTVPVTITSGTATQQGRVRGVRQHATLGGGASGMQLGGDGLRPKEQCPIQQGVQAQHRTQWGVWGSRVGPIRKTYHLLVIFLSAFFWILQIDFSKTISERVNGITFFYFSKNSKSKKKWSHSPSQKWFWKCQFEEFKKKVLKKIKSKWYVFLMSLSRHIYELSWWMMQW